MSEIRINIDARDFEIDVRRALLDGHFIDEDEITEAVESATAEALRMLRARREST